MQDFSKDIARYDASRERALRLHAEHMAHRNAVDSAIFQAKDVLLHDPRFTDTSIDPQIVHGRIKRMVAYIQSLQDGGPIQLLDDVINGGTP